MKELYRSISMDEGRIDVLEHPDGFCVVTKITTVKEVENMVEINTHLLSVKPFKWQDDLYKVVTPKIVSWDEAIKVLTLELKEGDNLEASLSSAGDNRKQNIDFTHQFFEWMKATGTFWRGAAPRHIVINSNQKEISLLDFERPVTLRQIGFKDEEFNTLLRGLVHEEFCAFLFDDEQSVVFPDIWKIESYNEVIRLNTIHGKRIKLLLEFFFGFLGETIRTEQLHFVYEFMSSIVTPFLFEGKQFYPLKAIDKKTKMAEDYVDMVLQLSKIDRSQWPTYLGYEIN